MLQDAAPVMSLSSNAVPEAAVSHGTFPHSFSASVSRPPTTQQAAKATADQHTTAGQALRRDKHSAVNLQEECFVQQALAQQREHTHTDTDTETMHDWLTVTAKQQTLNRFRQPPVDSCAQANPMLPVPGETLQVQTEVYTFKEADVCRMLDSWLPRVMLFDQATGAHRPG